MLLTCIRVTYCCDLELLTSVADPEFIRGGTPKQSVADLLFGPMRRTRVPGAQWTLIMLIEWCNIIPIEKPLSQGETICNCIIERFIHRMIIDRMQRMFKIKLVNFQQPKSTCEVNDSPGNSVRATNWNGKWNLHVYTSEELNWSVYQNKSNRQ